MLHATTSYKHVLDAFIAIFNGLNPNHRLDKIEKYKWKYLSLQNIFQSFLCFYCLFV